MKPTLDDDLCSFNIIFLILLELVATQLRKIGINNKFPIFINLELGYNLAICSVGESIEKPEPTGW